MRVVASRRAWTNLLRRAKARLPNEYIEAIWGVVTIDSFRLLAFKRMKMTKTTPCICDYDVIEVARQKWLAKKAGMVFLGTVHTHPGFEYRRSDASPSVMDHEGAIQDGEVMMGVIYMLQRKSGRIETSVKWWLPQDPLEFELLPE